MKISIITAIGKNNELGKNNALLWKLPKDMRHFRKTTEGKTVIMGRKTFESIGKALPSRRNIVLTKNTQYQSSGIEVVNSISEILDTETDEEIFIIGGAEIYKAFLPHAHKLYITHVDMTFKDADAFFPGLNLDIWIKKTSLLAPKDAEHAFDMEFAVYERI
ncbi:MAG: dihydrofolate reductase [Candidatus Paceibacteria bacterium]